MLRWEKTRILVLSGYLKGPQYLSGDTTWRGDLGSDTKPVRGDLQRGRKQARKVLVWLMAGRAAMSSAADVMH